MYPIILEEWWISYALRQLGCKSLQEREAQLKRAIQSLSDRYTIERNIIYQDYFRERDALSAYGLFFFPQTYVRTTIVLQELLFRGWNPEWEISILDLGSGAGAASLAVAALLNDRAAQLTAVDHSRSALEAMQDLTQDCASLWSMLKIHTVQDDFADWIRNATGKWDLILACFSLNETDLSIEQQTELFERLLSDRGIVLVLEPALKFTSEKLESWRDLIAKRSDLQIWAPCLHQLPCPLLQEGKYWCHEVRPWQAPNSLRFFNRHLYRQAHVLKFSFLAFGKTGPSPIESFAFRLISPVSRQKRNFRFTGCTTGGEKKDFLISSALISGEQTSVKDWERGDIVASFDGPEKKKFQLMRG